MEHILPWHITGLAPAVPKLHDMPLYVSLSRQEKLHILTRQAIAMAEIVITGFQSHDVRFPTSLDKTGSDAMNAAGDYSAAYCILETDSFHTGHGMVCDSAAWWMIDLS